MTPSGERLRITAPKQSRSPCREHRPVMPRSAVPNGSCCGHFERQHGARSQSAAVGSAGSMIRARSTALLLQSWAPRCRLPRCQAGSALFSCRPSELQLDRRQRIRPGGGFPTGVSTRLTAGGRWIRTCGTAAQKPRVSAAFRVNRGVRDDRSQDTAKTLLDGLRQP